MSSCPETCGTCEHHKRTEKNFTCFKQEIRFLWCGHPVLFRLRGMGGEKKMGGRKRNDLTGRQIGFLTVIREAEGGVDSNNKPYTAWLCRCICGKMKVIRTCNLTGRHHTLSCGCIRRKEYNTTIHIPIEHIALPEPLTARERLSEGATYKIGRKLYTLTRKYDDFGQFTDASGFNECIRWWDIQKFLDKGRVVLA